MTTNHVERLDPALIRPGRVDYRQFFGNATEQMLRKVIRNLGICRNKTNCRCLFASMKLVRTLSIWRQIQRNLCVELCSQAEFCRLHKFRAISFCTSTALRLPLTLSTPYGNKTTRFLDFSLEIRFIFQSNKTLTISKVHRLMDKNGLNQMNQKWNLGELIADDKTLTQWYKNEISDIIR